MMDNLIFLVKINQFEQFPKSILDVIATNKKQKLIDQLV